MTAAYLLLAAPPSVVFLIVLFNVWKWPRGRADGQLAERVSVLIPARNEVHNLESCVRAALDGTRVPDEILVYDDGSSDGTSALATLLAAEDPRVRVLHGEGLPDGWIGKPHACHRLAEHATGEVLVFMDADVALLPTGLARVGSLLVSYQADVVTAGLRQRMGGWTERLVIPLLHLTYLAWLPLPLVWRTRDPRLLAANGQLLAVTREAYALAGGWASVRAEVVDDMAFCRQVKRTGGRVVFADGFRIASCRMYRSGQELWQGFSKNLYEGIGGTPVSLLGILALYALVFVAPYVALVGAMLGGWLVLLRPAILGIAANVGVRAVLALRFRQPPEGVLLHPLSILALLAIAINSWRWSRRGSIEWRGRSYAARRARLAE
jgi:glycosyltransferase involved in cell wall biosynthesis